MNDNVVSAIAALQGHALGEQRQRSGEILEEALSDLVRNPDRESDAEHQRGSALARARTKVQRRKRLVPNQVRLDRQTDDEKDEGDRKPALTPATDDAAKQESILIRDALERSNLSQRDRNYLRLAELGFASREIAQLESVSTNVARVRLTRARGRARRVWRDAA